MQHREKEASYLLRRRRDHIVADISKAVFICQFSKCREGPLMGRKSTVVNYSTKHTAGHVVNNRAALCRQPHSLEKCGVSGVVAEVFE
jgi:hypothetical protein